VGESEGELQALVHRLEQLELAVQELHQGVIVFDGGGALRFANRRAHEILGEPFEELTEALNVALATGRPVVGDVIAVERHARARLLLETRAVPITNDGGVESVVVTFDDVTERERRERAERDFVTNAAHELQTPLAAITSAIEVLQAGAKRRPEDRDRFLGHIEGATERLVRLTRALLVLARAQTRDEAPRQELIEVEPFLRSLATVLSTERIVVECDPDVAVIANRPLLEQALANLGENALKYAPATVAFRARRADGAVTIDVQDRGPGIPAPDCELVFQRFFRSGNSDNEGFGLGLAIVREAVEALEGELALDTGANGTRVSIRLPGATVRGR
jgi:signal transduction histidine kinase